MTDRLLKIGDVIAMTSLSRSHIYALRKRGDFPAPISLGSKCSRWMERDVAAWINLKAG